MKLLNIKWNGKINYIKNKETFELKDGNGYIKEYDFGCGINNFFLKFEGEYLNEDKNGKGKEYDEDGNLIFEGKYLNGNKCNEKNIRNLIIIFSNLENLIEEAGEEEEAREEEVVEEEELEEEEEDG